MKFVNYLEKITGVDVYALTSFSIFFVFFLMVLFWVYKGDKEMFKKINQLPLDN